MAEVIRIGGMVSCYLVVDKGSAVLVDTGPRFMRALVERRMKRYDVKLIVITHGHADHAANAAYFAQKHGIPVAIHEADRALLKAPQAQPMHADTLLGRMIAGMSGMMGVPDDLKALEPSVSLSDGMSLVDYGVNATIIALPGHTEGSIGVLVDGDKLIVGDAVMNLAGTHISRLFVDKQQMLGSMEAIRALGVRTVYVGHGRTLRAERL